MKISANLIDSLIDPGGDGDQWQHKFNGSNRSDILSNIFALVDAIRKGDSVASLMDKTTNLSNYLNWITSLRSYVGELNEQHRVNINHTRLCSYCKEELQVPFYRCSHCSDFLLCANCEIRSEEIHDYVFMKIKKQNNADIGSSNLESISKFLDKFHSVLSTLLEDLLTSDFAKALEFGENDSIILSNPESILNVVAGRVITKIWKIRNNGSCDWNEKTKLKWVSGLTAIDSRKSISVPPLKSSEEADVWVDFLIPSNIMCEQIYESNWCLCNGETEFGKPFGFKIRAIPISTNSVECSSLRGDESIKFPACFDLTVPFQVEVNTDIEGTSCETEKKDEQKESHPSQSQDGVSPPQPKVEDSLVKESIYKKQQSSNKSVKPARVAGKTSKPTRSTSDLHSSILRRPKKCSGIFPFMNMWLDPKLSVRTKLIEADRSQSRFERYEPLTRSLCTLAHCAYTSKMFEARKKMVPGDLQQKDSLKRALAKLSQMGFCNVNLNTRLLTRNQLDIQRTLLDLNRFICNYQPDDVTDHKFSVENID